jgi:hypothetical protein
MIHMFQPHTVKPGNMVIIKRIEDLASVLAAADKTHLAQPAQLMGDCGLGHTELRGNITNIHFAFEQNRNDPQTGWVTESAEQVSKMGEGLFLKYHDQYMNSCSSIHNYRIKEKNRQMTILTSNGYFSH